VSTHEFDCVVVGGGTAGNVTVTPCVTTMMIGEKCADLLREDARA
jgi:choline dehydrogenase-like flavoprotein